MVTTLNVKCPHCGQVSQIFLTTSVCVIILNCPSCLSPLMYFRRKIFLLDPRQLKLGARGTRQSMVMKLLEQFAGCDASAPCTAKKAATHTRAGTVPLPAAPRLTFTQPEEKYITKDDCTNLRIDLALCADSREFINRL